VEKDGAFTPEVKKQRTALEKQPFSRRRHPLDSSHWSKVERSTGKVSQSQHVLETVKEVGRARNLAETLANPHPGAG